MIRRPPSGIALRQSDIVEMEAFLAERRAAQAMEDASKEATSTTGGDKDRQGSRAASINANAAKGKGKGKQRANEVTQDELMQSEEQHRNAREAKTREQRIGI